MILVLSPSYADVTTDAVVDWLEARGADWLRLNGEDVDGGAALSLEIDRAGVRCLLRRDTPAGVTTIDPAQVKAVWFRGWLREWRHEGTRLVAEESPQGERLQYDIRLQLTREGRKLSEFLHSCFDGAGGADAAEGFGEAGEDHWLGSPRTVSPNKPAVLRRAAAAGIDIPSTLITTERAALREFAARHGAIISKPTAETILLTGGEATHALYTAVVPDELIERLPERFPPTLFQELLAKEYELRVFYLDGECHAMAIFSQRDPQTAIDFRRYNRARPNRCVPYLLPGEMQHRMRSLMDGLGLATGSLDLVHTPDGRDVFLEVNPVGQFGMVSHPCNYHLERRVAERLLERAARP